MYVPFISYLVFLSEHSDCRKPTHSVIILQQKIQYSKVNISHFFSLGTVTLSLLTYLEVFLTGNICKPVSGIPAGGKYLFWEVKNPALTQLNLAAKLDLIHSENEGTGPSTTLDLFWSFGLHSSPFPVAHTAQQAQPLLGTSTGFCAQPVIVEDLLTEKSSSNQCVGQCITYEVI